MFHVRLSTSPSVRSAVLSFFRAHLLSSAHAPHTPLSALVFVFLFSPPQVYDWIAGAKLVVPPSHYMSREEAMFSFPKLREKVTVGRSPFPLLIALKSGGGVDDVRGAVAHSINDFFSTKPVDRPQGRRHKPRARTD